MPWTTTFSSEKRRTMTHRTLEIHPLWQQLRDRGIPDMEIGACLAKRFTVSEEDWGKRFTMPITRPVPMFSFGVYSGIELEMISIICEPAEPGSLVYAPARVAAG
jgi:hypothetical protein